MREKYPFATLLSYCPNDYRYLKKCIDEVKKFSSQIVIAVCDRYFSGEEIDPELLYQVYEEYPECEFVEFSYNKNHLYNPNINRTPIDNDWIDFWHSTSRYVPFFFLKDPCEYVLFLDSDEIIEGDLFLSWLDSGEYKKYDAVRWLQYYYFREARYQSKNFQIGGLMAKRSVLKPSLLMNTDDRCGIFHVLEGEKCEGISMEGVPMIHHYSWVKSKEECLLKARNWSHFWERDWKLVIEEEFSRDFNGKDFEGREYRKLKKCYFDPMKVETPRKKMEKNVFPNVTRVDDQELRKRELIFEFDL